jgi:DNA-binding response OmpR family regulator
VPPAIPSFGSEDAPSSRVLIVDDNPRIHRDFELVLLEELENPELDTDEQRLYGVAAQAAAPRVVYLLDHASSGLEGIGKVRQSLADTEPYQLAFVDIRMPGLNGVETIERMWQVDRHLQVVICTAYADFSQEDLTARLGHTDKLLVLKKPFDNIEVTQLARTLTKKWHLARQAALKLEQMELLVSQRTQKVLALQAQEVRRLREEDLQKHESLNQLAREFQVPLAQLAKELGKTPAGGGFEPARQELLHRQLGELSLLVRQLADGSNGKPAGPPAVVESSPKMAETESTGPKLPLILLVESAAGTGGQIRGMLGADYKIEAVGDDRDGWQKAHGLVPDIIIADIFPPQVDGVRLCREVKAAQLTSHIPVILLNTRAGEDYQMQALEAGADDYIPPPLNLELLKARVENLLASRRNLRARFHQQSVMQPRDLALNQADAHFLQRTLAVIEQNLADFEFDVEALARGVAVSRRQLFRKLEAVVDLSPKALIRSLRLKRAGQLLLDSEMTVTEITFAVGFQDVKHFRTLFREQYGVLPSEYLNSVVARQAKA